MSSQVIWLGPGATSFAVLCDACGEERRRELHLNGTVVEGTLRLEADVGFTTCRRGHRLRVRRVSRVRVAAVA